MAGVKGRSGGPRKNSGGRRPGAGRKPKVPRAAPVAPVAAPKARARKKALPELTGEEEASIGARLPPAPGFVPPPPPPPSDTVPSPLATGIKDAKTFLEGVIAGDVLATPDQIRAAQALLPFQHKKLGETGKKEQRQEDAQKVARFSPAPPRLAALGGRKV